MGRPTIGAPDQVIRASLCGQIHKPNTCGKPSQQGNSNKPAKQGKSAFNLEAMAAELTAQGFSADEVTSKMEAIMAVIES